MHKLYCLQSSLLHAIIRELPLSNGNISVHGVLSYASQEPWIFSGSVQENILFGSPMDKNRYAQVRACILVLYYLYSGFVFSRIFRIFLKTMSCLRNVVAIILVLEVFFNSTVKKIHIHILKL